MALPAQVYSLAAFSPDGGLMGMVVGELQPLASLETEAGAVLDTTTADTTVMYIVSLGRCPLMYILVSQP